MIPCIHKTMVFCGCALPGVAFVHAGRVFCGCALPGGGICPRWEGILWIDAPAGNGFSRKLLPFGDKVPAGNGFSRKDTFFGDKSISLGAAMEFSPGNCYHLGTKFPPAMVSPGNCYHLGIKINILWPA